jgi:hypothetical protein
VYFWILIILARKLGLALTSLMFRSNPAFQLAMSLLVTFYSYVLQVAYRPYLCLGENRKVIAEHKRSVADGSRLHSKIDLSLRYAAKVRSQNGAASATKLGLGRAAPAVMTTGFAAFLVNYNTVESVLLACAVFVNLVRTCACTCACACTCTCTCTRVRAPRRVCLW